jgi:AraC-like DNA-binding protein
MDPRIAHALEQMHAARCAAPIADIARGVNLSTSRFTHLFHEEVGAPPARYLLALRMTRARLLLERTFLSIKEVMAQVGCNDASHFSRDFRRFFGASPSEWRAGPERRQPQGVEDAIESATVARIAALANAPAKSPSVGGVTLNPLASDEQFNDFECRGRPGRAAKS